MNANSVDPLVIGKRIRAARERLGWSQTELAQRAGSVASYQSRLEAGQFERPSVERLSAIARALGVTLAELTDAAPPLSPLLAYLVSPPARWRICRLSGQFAADTVSGKRHS
jgi:transcriptional regulator with XRE-family HTH domain